MWTAKERERDRFCSLAVCPAVNCRKNEHHQQKVTEKNRRQQKAQKKHPSTQPRSLRATELVNHLDKVHHRSAPVMLLFSRISFNFSFFAGFFFQSFILFFFCRRFFFPPLFNLKFIALQVFKILPAEEQTAALTPHPAARLDSDSDWTRLEGCSDLLIKRCALVLEEFVFWDQAESGSAPELEE